jgi:hypothetical protein
MTKKSIRFVQSQLNARGLDAGPEDGVLGPKTLSALDQVEGIPRQWPKTRRAVAFIQLLAKERNIETGAIDGYWGPQTEFAFDSLLQLIQENKAPEIWRPEDLPDENPNNWPVQTPESNLVQAYGGVGQNQTRIDLPFPHKLAWETTRIVNSYLCHERVHDSLHRVLSRVLSHYGLEEIHRLRLDFWGGCLNVRKMRGGSRYSMHSWGIAVDYDPGRNRLGWGRDRAAFAKPEYGTWWRLWEEEGWVSLGRTRNFDWMHVQAAKI